MMYRNYLAFIFLLILGCWSMFPASAQQGNFKNYSVNDGLAQSQVYSITEAADGYLWIGTRGGGLCRFDGLEFETYTKKNGLSSNYITYLYFDRHHNLWIGTSNGLCVYRDGKFNNINIDKSYAVSIVNSIMEDYKGRLWIGTDHGLYLQQGNAFEKRKCATENMEQEITCIIESDKQGLWIGTNHGLMNIAADTIITYYTTKNGLINNYIRSLAYDNAGNLWVGTYGRGISIFTNNEFISFDQLQTLKQSVIHDLKNDSKGNMWIATLEEGLIKWNSSDSTLSYFNEADGLANNHVRCIFEDSWHNLWIGTSGGGMSKYFGQQFDHYNSSSISIKSNYIYAIETVNDSDVWISTSGLGVNRYMNNKTVYYGKNSGFTDVKVKTIMQSSDSIVWLGTEGKGLFFFAQDTFLSGSLNANIGSNWIKDIKEDADKNIWVATSGAGICKISIDRSGQIPDYSYLHFNTSNGLQSNRVNLLHIDKENKVWFAYQTGGLGYIKADTTIYHVPQKQEVSSSPIRSMAEDQFKHLWIGTGGKGVFRLQLYTDSLTFVNYTSDRVLNSDNIYLLDIDYQYNLWVGSEKGVEKIKLDNEGNPLDVTTYGADEGFNGVETSKNAIAIDNKGGVWIGTINGLYRYNANYNSDNNKPPLLSITDVSLFYSSIKETLYASFLKEREQNKNARIILDYDQNQIAFDFKGLVLTKPKQVKYKWRLSGLEKEWSPATYKNSITYSNLNAGNYIFQVLSCNEDGIWNETPREVPFTILAPFWKKTWFRASSILLIIVVIGLIIWSRFRIANKKALTAQELLKMENEVLVLEQKALRLQMNPHFIFNCLNSIQSMIIKKDHKTARYFLSKFSKLMRKTLDNSREQLILLDDEIEILENYLSIEKFCNEDHFDYVIRVSDDIASDFIQIPPMLIQPFVENAIVHGVTHKDSGGMIAIDFRMEGNTLICTIEDNGVGRKASGEYNKKRKAIHKSTALIVTQERLEYLGKNTIGQQLLIKDLYDEKGQACGTKVILKLVIAD